MLPFLKNKEAMVQNSSDEETLRRKSDDGESFGMVDAIAEDMLAAFEKKDKGMLKAALESLCDYLKEEDEEQDELLIKKDE